MEKRTVIAIVLSIFVLYFYNLTVAQKVAKTQNLGRLNSSQSIENKELVYNKTVELTVQPPSVAAPEAPLPTVPEKTATIENENFKLIFSVGSGSIKSVYLKKYDYTFSLDNILSENNVVSRSYELVSAADTEVSFVFKNKFYEINKKFILDKGSNGIVAEFKVQNNSLESEISDLNFNIFNINVDEMSKQKDFVRDQGLLEYIIASSDKIYRKNNAFKFSEKEKITKETNINWIGFRDRYFCAVLKPDFSNKLYRIDPKTDKNLSISIEPEKISLKPNENISYKFLIFMGPQDVYSLKDFSPGFEEIVKFSNFSILDIISKLIVESITFFNKYIKSWGFSIILVSIIIYFLLYPLSLKSTYSMKKMQSLQPKIEQLKSQYKSNPQKLNSEIMDLYRKNSVNPLGGCLPVLLQMPIFIGLYQALWRSVSFKGASFFWIKDLAEPDRFFILPFSLPLIGNEINLLAFIVTFLMFLQQKVYSRNVFVTDPNQLMQQKIMTTVFPIMFGFLFYKFSSGLFLYFTVFYSLTVITQWKIMKVKEEIVH